MTAQASRPAYEPQDLERLLVSTQNAGDVEGMAALYEPQALLDDGEGRVIRDLNRCFHSLDKRRYYRTALRVASHAASAPFQNREGHRSLECH